MVKSCVICVIVKAMKFYLFFSIKSQTHHSIASTSVCS